MTKVNLPYVKIDCGRDGRPHYAYFRRNGRRWRLPGLPGDPAFLVEYQRLLAATAAPTPAPHGERPLPGSFGAVVLDYMASPEFKATKPATQRVYRLILEKLAEEHGLKPIAMLERRHVKAWRDARAEKPGMANLLVRVVHVLCNYAIENDLRKDNPASRIKTFKLGEHRAWTDEECLAFEARWAPGTMQRRAYMLAKFTGQRCGDLANMTRAHRKDGAIRVTQQKTGAEVLIPEHRDLAAELALGVAGHMSVLTKPDGSAFDADWLSQWFADAIAKAGLPEECVMHGLRKTAARALAEVGCTAHEIAAITGHKSLVQVQHYTRAADQKRLATAAIHRLERNSPRT
jgi:integrase